MKIRLIAIAAASALACSVSLTPTAQADSAGLDYFIDSPYAGVDWNWTQYKSGFHYHTTESDGGDSAREMITTAYDLGFNSTPSGPRGTTRPAPRSNRRSPTTTRCRTTACAR